MKFLTTLTQKTTARAIAEITTGQLSRAGKLALMTLAMGSVAMMTSTTAAIAGGQGLNGLLSTTVQNTNKSANIITYGAYIIGTGLTVLGLLDIKKHIDNPSNKPLKDGLGKLGIGGLLFFAPFVVETASKTFGANGTTVQQVNMGTPSI